MTSELEFRVYGTPAPQGSKTGRAIYRGKGANKKFTGKVAMVESSSKVKPWREAVAAAANAAIRYEPEFVQLTGPVAVRIEFVLERLKSHYGTGRNANILKTSAPLFQCVPPDVDKLVRATFDALTTAGVWLDDGQAAHVSAFKVYGNQPGAHITLKTLAVTA